MLTLSQYQTQLWSWFEQCNPQQQRTLARYLARTDLYYLLRYVLNREDVQNEWLFQRCREVQASPNGYLDLWSREHYKSTIITFAKTLQDILASHGDDPLPEWKNREATIGIFSHTRPQAKGFLRQIKYEAESNRALKDLFPDVIWTNPARESPKWSEDDGIVFRRRSNPKEATLEAWGLVDGQPTGKHFLILVYDDVVTDKSVTTPEMIQKTTDSLALSYNLGADGGIKRFVGTRYHFNDTYKTIIDRGTAVPRLHPATDNGRFDGSPVLWTPERLAEKRRDMGPYVASCQLMQNPVADEAQGFKREWLRYYKALPDIQMLNWYILVDAANGKRKLNDYTSMWAVGIGPDQNYYCIPEVRDRLNLTQRADRLFAIHRKYKPLQVRYERYGLMADIEHMKTRMERETYRFDIVEVAGAMPKEDRIKRLIPLFEAGRIYLPTSHHITDYQGYTRDLVHDFIEEEYAAFPVCVHDDMFDALARIAEPELNLTWPAEQTYKPMYQPMQRIVGSTGWMT
jgi:phage terminase large subunit-like protein